MRVPMRVQIRVPRRADLRFRLALFEHLVMFEWVDAILQGLLQPLLAGQTRRQAGASTTCSTRLPLDRSAEPFCLSIPPRPLLRLEAVTLECVPLLSTSRLFLCLELGQTVLPFPLALLQRSAPGRRNSQLTASEVGDFGQAPEASLEAGLFLVSER